MVEAERRRDFPFVISHFSFSIGDRRILLVTCGVMYCLVKQQASLNRAVQMENEK